MALSGPITVHYPETDPVITDEVTVTYPADLPADDPDYDKRGTTETENVPHTNFLSASYDNCYVRVSSVNVITPSASERDIYTEDRTLTFAYNVFPSSASKAISGSSYYQDVEVNINYDITATPIPFEAAYNYLKTKTGYDNLVDA